MSSGIRVPVGVSSDQVPPQKCRILGISLQLAVAPWLPHNSSSPMSSCLALMTYLELEVSHMVTCQMEVSDTGGSTEA